jgi:hypothetical protein
LAVLGRDIAGEIVQRINSLVVSSMPLPMLLVIDDALRPVRELVIEACKDRDPRTVLHFASDWWQAERILDDRDVDIGIMAIASNVFSHLARDAFESGGYGDELARIHEVIIRRAIAMRSGLKVVVFSSWGIEAAKRSIGAGAFAHVHLPFELAELKRIFDEAHRKPSSVHPNERLVPILVVAGRVAERSMLDRHYTI